MAFEKMWATGNCRNCDRCITSIKISPCEWCEHEDSVKCDFCGKGRHCKFEFKKQSSNG